MSAITALIEAVTAKDAATYRHSQRTARFAAALARDVGYPEEHIALICAAGLLHDIGKVQIPDEILHKPALLTSAEWAVMRGHSELGAKMVERAGLPKISIWIRHLHERYDGLGYPDGLVADEIPLESRILHAADTLEAMTSSRPYRGAAPTDEALAALEEAAGTQLDPVFSVRLAELVREGSLQLHDSDEITIARRGETVTPLTAGASLATV